MGTLNFTSYIELLLIIQFFIIVNHFIIDICETGVQTVFFYSCDPTGEAQGRVTPCAEM